MQFIRKRIPVDRDAIKPEHFKKWADWVRQKYRTDFIPHFSHPLSETHAVGCQ